MPCERFGPSVNTRLTATQTFSLTIGGVAQHLISYYKVEDVEQGRLRSPSTLPELASLEISPEYLDKTHFRNPPKVEIGVDGIPRYRGEADEPDQSPLLSTPLLLPSPDDEGPSKRGKRYDPYGNPSAPSKRRSKKSTTLSTRSQESAGEEAPSPTYSSPVHHSSPVYAEAGSLSATTNPHYATSPYGYYSGYPQYGSTYPPASTSSSYPPAPVSPMPPQQTPTPPPPAAAPQLAYTGYTDTTAASAANTYSYYPPPTQPTYGSYPQVWSGYSGYSSSGMHHQHSGDSHDGLHKEDREEVDSAA